MWGRIKNRESSFACYRTTPLIHTGYAYSERALAETGTDQDWLAIPWNSNRGSRTSRDPIHNKLPQAATIPLCRVVSAPRLNAAGRDLPALAEWLVGSSRPGGPTMKRHERKAALRGHQSYSDDRHVDSRSLRSRSAQEFASSVK